MKQSLIRERNSLDVVGLGGINDREINDQRCVEGPEVSTLRACPLIRGCSDFQRCCASK